jgi:hypothetical protein
VVKHSRGGIVVGNLHTTDDQGDHKVPGQGDGKQGFKALAAMNVSDVVARRRDAFTRLRGFEGSGARERGSCEKG